jgi:hypothetical protein
MQVHRPDFPALIAALEANLPPEPKRAPLVTPPRPPSPSYAQQAKDLAEDDRITHALLAPPMKLVFKEPAYIPDFARPAEVVIGIDLGSGDETVVATLAPSSAVPAGWTNSRDAEPACAGWYEVEGIEGEEWAAYYFGIGLGWSNDIEACASMESKADALEDRFEKMDWRGPRLTGADWPEPAAPAAEEVPSVEAMNEAYAAARFPERSFIPEAMGLKYHARFIEEMPREHRAEFIRRCAELR